LIRGSLKPRKTKNRARIEPHQLPTLLSAMDNFSGQTVVKLALKLMAITFVRSEELLDVP
jgi:integrase